MRRSLFLAAFALALLVTSQLSATWSIIAIDEATGRVGISSATCATRGPDQLKLLQAIVMAGVRAGGGQAPARDAELRGASKTRAGLGRCASI